jgi:hypothetical protein
VCPALGFHLAADNGFEAVEDTLEFARAEAVFVAKPQEWRLHRFDQAARRGYAARLLKAGLERGKPVEQVFVLVAEEVVAAPEMTQRGALTHLQTIAAVGRRVH